MLCRTIAVVLCLILVGPVAAQSAASDNQEFDILPDVITVYQDGGPAWWKVTKGASTVFILGLPSTTTPRDLEWDRRTLQRRLKGARLVLAPHNERLGSIPRSIKGATPPKFPKAPPQYAARVVAAANRLGGGMSPSEVVRVDDMLNLRSRYMTFHKLTHGAVDEVYEEIRRAKVPIVTSAAYEHRWTEMAKSFEYVGSAACYEQILKDVETPIEAVRTSAHYWAVGDVEKAFSAAPPELIYSCRDFWPGFWERSVGFQTNAIAQSLQKPGKIIAIAPITLLVSRNGILERLRAQGFTISDPAKPLTD